MSAIEVCFSPILYKSRECKESIVVVIDILRATTAICTAFQNGVKEIIPVATVKEAEEYKKKGFLVGAERNGMKLDGFDFGNSPYDYIGNYLKNKTIVLTTTNGTQAINTSKDAYKVVIGAFTNITVLCHWLLQQEKNILLLCSGWKNRFNMEDSVFAGAVVSRLTKEKHYDKLADSALAARYLFESANDKPFRLLANSSHRRRLAELNLKKDIKYSLTLDQTDIIPYLQDGKIVRMKN